MTEKVLLEAKKVFSTPNEELRNEFDQIDQQYSYEHAVLGSYRLETSGAEQIDEGNTPTILTTLAVPSNFNNNLGEQKENEAKISIQSITSKKSVRFKELIDIPELWVNNDDEDLNNTKINKNKFGIKFKEMIKKPKKAFSWKNIRLILIDWLFLGILGIGMALTSMLIDGIVEYLQTFQLVLMTISGNTGNIYFDYFCTYLSWLGYTELLVICSAIFVHYVAPQAIGSGIPEMKCSLRGVVLKDYLAARTLISKIVGLTFSLGSGIPIGKMGPFVHVAASTANLLSNLAARFEGAYGNECRKSEMLAAACATGVACCFSSPIGGVLFSIETTTMHFSVRNYWRGFFAAACGATVFRLLRVVVFETEVTLVAFYQTHFPEDAFEPEELPFFAIIGLLCGFIGAGFIVFYKSFVLFLRQNSFVKEQIRKNWLIYPIIIAFLVATVTYPRGYGRFLSGRLFNLLELLGSWSNHEGYGPYNVFLVLTLFTFTFLLLAALCNTMPIPCGMFMPLFVVGAAFGRLIGEIIATIFPDGIPGGTDQPIFPGIYAVVGAASLTGAITHSVSVAMICCEITGQLIYLIPLMIAVIIANAVCAYIQPSIYDVMIGIKNLPYLPDIPPSNAEVHLYTAENIMEANVRYICRVTKYEEIRKLIIEMPKLRSFPVVDDPNSLMLLGSISRRTILELLNAQIGEEARKKEAERRIRMAIETIDKHFREAQMDDSKSESDNTIVLDIYNRIEQLEEEEKENNRRRVFSHGANDMLGILPNGKNQDKKHKMIGRCSLSESSLVQKMKNFDDFKIKKTKENNKPKKEQQKQQKISLNSQVFPIIEKQEENNNNLIIEDYIKDNNNNNRFIVEPVISTKKRNLSSGQLFPSSKPVRRNAFALIPWKTISDSDESSETSSPPLKKISCPDLKMASVHSQWGHFDNQLSLSKNISEYVRSVKRKLRIMQNKHLTESVNYDLHDDERREWELNKLNEIVEIEEKLIDPAPFQLVRRTSVYKVHSLFSLLDLNRAYVTDRGHLVGVVALRDLRIAIQKSQSGLPMHHSNLDTQKTKQRSSVYAVKSENNSNIVDTSELKENEKKEQTESSLQIINEEFEPKEFINNETTRLRLGSRIFENQNTPTSEHIISSSDPNNVVQAVEYLRRRSVAVEDLKTLEETPLPEVQDLQKDENI
ncbi:Chloride channel protein [Meloidogyne graminicola]|uniref:Chloride channel protein n=1 Tax=Meloidogyne graminicola TaxID=189291 RepID=A0A8T0A002_9BILA|nr:Chloride channel protein [Meloidogyne graminicola]